ncbi:STAS domain-containing protein [Xylanimonas allomyrinae]|uniref:STAS domain-containing protein n=1 Tax=Xylanimonas allomyrinae TaxID=2509459 RepID=UPI001FE7CE8B|nr:STAS domain-containing protein [Xylanimonas allomyrinae]
MPVEIDAHHITFMDSSGVAFLARLGSRMPHKVRILRAPPTVKFLLEVTRIGELLEIVDEDEGLD